MNDDHVIDIARSRKGVRDILEDTSLAAAPKTVREAASMDDLGRLPSEADAYTAHARAANKPVPTLIFILANGEKHGFPYALVDRVDMLAAEKPGEGPFVRVRFSGVEISEVRIQGRNLDPIYNYLCFQRISWIRQCGPAGEFLQDQACVVTQIDVASS